MSAFYLAKINNIAGDALTNTRITLNLFSGLKSCIAYIKKRTFFFSRVKPSIALHSHSDVLALQQTMNSNLAKVLSVLDNFHHSFLAFSSSLTALVKFQTVSFLRLS